MKSLEFSTRTTTAASGAAESSSTGSSSNLRNLIRCTGFDASRQFVNNDRQNHVQDISISPKDDKDLFSDVDSSDDEADISLTCHQQQQRKRQQDEDRHQNSNKTDLAGDSSSLGSSPSPGPIPHAGPRQLPLNEINFKIQSTTTAAVAAAQVENKFRSSTTKNVRNSRGPQSQVEMTTFPNGHDNSSNNNNKSSSRKTASSSISPAQPMSKQKPRKKRVLTSSRKRRTKLIAQKSILEQQQLQSHLSNPELKRAKCECRVRDLEKIHYGKNGEFLSGTKIPAIFMNEIMVLRANDSLKTMSSTDFPLRTGKEFRNRCSLTDKHLSYCLEQLGWVRNPRSRQQLLTLNENGQVLQLSMDRIRGAVNRAKDRLPVYEQGVVIDSTLFGKIEEELLLQKIQHDIDVIASVQVSCHTNTEDTAVDETCFEISTADEHMDEHMDVSRNSSSHDDLESLPTMTPKPSELIEDSQRRNDDMPPAKVLTKLCRITKYFPKYLGDSNELLITEEMLAYFSRPKLKITLKDHSEENETSVVVFCGLKDDIDAVLTSIVNVIQKKIINYNSDLLFGHENSLEVDVKFDITKELGIKTVKAKKSIWVQHVLKGGQFDQIFDSRLQGGAAITSMGLMKSNSLEPIFSNKAKNAFLARAKGELDKDHCDINKWIIVRICLLNDGNIDIDKIVTSNSQILHHSKRSSSRFDEKANRKAPLNHKTGEKKSKLNVESTITSGSSLSKKRKLPSPPSKDPSSSISTENLPRKKLHQGEKNILSKAMTDKDTSYRHFRDKTQPVREIEFKNRVNGHAACGSMWMQHKKLFGDHCDTNCNCVAEMDKLVKNIVTGGTSSDSGDKVGFADSFCPKFFDKVQKYFPNNSAEQILLKLVDMWKLGHVKQRTLGAMCDASCSCGNLWSLLFLLICRGDLLQKDDTKLSIHSSAEACCSDENIFFDITFRPSVSSLGFYCETHICDESKPQCIVKSVDPRMKVVSKLTPGTIVDCYILGKETVKVSTHQQLERVYNVLKTRGDKSPLTIRFKKVKNSHNDGNYDCSRDWSETNSWIGELSKQGWAGGAMVIKGGKKLNKGTRALAKESAKALRQKEKFLPQSAKEVIREVMKGSKNASLVNSNRTRSGQGITGALVLTHRDRSVNVPNNTFQKDAKPPLSGSLLPPKKHSQYLGKHTDNSSSLAIHASRPLTKKYVSTSSMIPSILKKEKKTTQNKSRVKFDFSQNVVNTYIPDSAVSNSPKNTEMKYSEEKLTESIMCGQNLERFVEMLKHCVHDFKYESPLQTLTDRIRELNEEKETLTTEDLSSAEMSERQKQIDKDLYQFEMKKKIVKIYAKAHQILRTIGNSTPDVIKVNIIEHVESHSVEITKQILTLYDWLMRFRDEASHAGISLDIDANVDVHGVSLAHAAVFVGDSNLLQTLIQGGAQMKSSKCLGTPYELCQFLLNQALMKGNLTWTKKYMKVISVLENIRSPN